MRVAVKLDNSGEDVVKSGDDEATVGDNGVAEGVMKVW